MARVTVKRTIPRRYIDGYANSLEKISDEMRTRLTKALEAIDYTRPVAEVREELIPIMQTHVFESRALASQAAAEFYDGLREFETGKRLGAVGYDGYDADAVESRVRSAVQPLAEAQEEFYWADDIRLGTEYQAYLSQKAARELCEALADYVGYSVKSAAGGTVFANGRRDSKPTRFARVPRGSKSYPHGCPFCQMLASRGFVYRNAKTAGEMNHFHADCQCMVVPGFGDNPKVEGYDPKEYLDRWQHPEKYENEAIEQEETKPASLIDRQYSGVSNISEATERAAAFVDTGAYKSKVDMKGMSVDAANSMLKALDAVYDSYDVGPLRSIQRMNKRSREFKTSTAEAAYRWMLGDLFYNADYVKTPKAMAAHREESRKLLEEVLGGNLDRLRQRHAKNAPMLRYIDALERTGRATVSQSFESFEEVTYAHELGHMLDDRIFRKSSFDRKASFERYAGGISGYATADVKEYMAESFSAFYAGELEHLDPELVKLFRGSMK